MSIKQLIIGFTGICILIGTHAYAQTPNALSKVYACETITDSAQRLACYDDSVGQLRNAQNTGELVAIDKEAAENIEKESFGLKIPSLPKLRIFNTGDGDKKIKTPKERSLAISRVSNRPNGYLRFHLENGQVWIQTQPAKVRHLGLADPDMFVVRKAALGSFQARINDKGPRVRVRRIE